MGQKANPYALRLGINQIWNSNYLASKKEQALWLEQDKLIRDIFYPHRLDILQIKIERTATELIILLHSTNTNLIAGENNQNFDSILQKLRTIVNNEKVMVKLHLIEERKVHSSARSLANILAKQIEDRVSFRMAARYILNKIGFQRDVQGIKIRINGRDGTDIARHELISQGKMPLSTLKEEIDYSQVVEAVTIYGKVGINVWIYHRKEKEYNNHYNKKRNANSQKN